MYGDWGVGWCVRCRGSRARLFATEKTFPGRRNECWRLKDPIRWRRIECWRLKDPIRCCRIACFKLKDPFRWRRSGCWQLQRPDPVAPERLFQVEGPVPPPPERLCATETTDQGFCDTERTRRNPMRQYRFPGGTPPRCAERRPPGSSQKEPPRSTRCPQSVGSTRGFSRSESDLGYGA